jgi:hypothetical protein
MLFSANLTPVSLLHQSTELHVLASDTYVVMVYVKVGPAAHCYTSVLFVVVVGFALMSL